MPTREIERADWAPYLEAFSRQHAGDIVNVYTVDPTDRRTLLHTKPLSEVTFEETGSDSGEIAVEVGSTPESYLRHVVAMPEKVYHRDAAGAMAEEADRRETLEITSATDPQITLVELEPAAASA